MRLKKVRRNNLRDVSVSFPLKCLTAVTGVSGSGKSSLVSHALPALIGEYLGHPVGAPADGPGDELLLLDESQAVDGTIVGVGGLRRVVCIDQRPIGRTPRSNVASEGWVMVELLFLPSVYAPCPDCHGTRYQASTLEITWHSRNIAEVLEMSVDEARAFFDGDADILRSLTVLCDVGLGYLRLGQPATELSGGEAQRVKLATELQRAHRGDALYLLDEPTSGLHPADTDRLMLHLEKLVDAGNTVVFAELDMRVVVQADHVIDLGPGAGNEGGRVVTTGTPADAAADPRSATAPYLAAALGK